MTMNMFVDVDMGIGRQYGYDDLVRRYKETGVVVSSTPFIAASCHPRRPHHAHGLCQQCYHSWWKRGRTIKKQMWKTRLVGSQV